MRRCRPNGSVCGIYEHVRGILKHKHKLELDKKETYLPLLKLTQLKEYSRILKTTQTYSTQKYSRIRYSTQRYVLRLWVLNSGYSTQDKATIKDAIYGKLFKK